MSQLTMLDSKPAVFRVINKHDNEYASLQGMVANRYREAYQANVRPEPDMFALLRDEYRALAICGACYGVTSAYHKPLFSEYYLDDPVEALIQERFGVLVERKNIAEIGSLVSCDAPGAGKKIIKMIPWFISSLSFDYVLMTATTQLQKLLHSAGIVFHPVSRADISRLPSEINADQWGSYYDTKPLVGIIDVKATLYKSMLNEMKLKFNLNQVDIRYHKETHHVFAQQQKVK